MTWLDIFLDHIISKRRKNSIETKLEISSTSGIGKENVFEDIYL
jgi:hypothetical protein